MIKLSSHSSRLFEEDLDFFPIMNAAYLNEVSSLKDIADVSTKTAPIVGTQFQLENYQSKTVRLLTEKVNDIP